MAIEFIFTSEDGLVKEIQEDNFFNASTCVGHSG